MKETHTTLPIDRATVTKLIKDSKRPLKWPDLRDLMGVRRGSEVDQLRKLKRRLLDSGVITLTEKGHFALVEPRIEASGLLTYIGRGEWKFAQGEAGKTPQRVKVNRDLKARSGDTVLAGEQDDQLEVTKLVKRSPRLLFGRLVAYGKNVYVESEQPDFRGRVTLVSGSRKNDLKGAQTGDRVAVSVVGEDRSGLTGEFVEVIAKHDAVNRASTSLLRAYEVPMEWPDEVVESLSSLPDVVNPETARKNLVDMPLVTIDGADSRDFDDAVYCESKSGGGWRLVVAIADVAFYVKPDSPLDKTALLRGNSVYLPDQVVPMLPEQLSNDLCSLRPEEHRLALVCDMQISANGEVESFKFYEALIRSWHRLTYSQVFTWLQDKQLTAKKAVKKNLRALHECFLALNAQRTQRGALEFDSQEVTIQFDNAGEVCALEPVERNDAHKLIEEAMISANVCAAKFLADNKVPALYRVHGGPDGEKLEQLRVLMQSAGVDARCLQSGVPTPKQIFELLQQIKSRPDHKILEFSVLRSMQQAIYTPDNTGHFGLSLENYTHFTSPIRRYADLLVHRAIKSLVVKGYKDPGYSTEQLADIGQQISVTERRAEDVGRDVSDWYKCSYAEQFLGKQFVGRVMGVTNFGLFIQLEEIWVQGLMHVSNLGSDFFEFVPEQMSLVGEKSGQRFHLGQTVDVILAEVDVESRKIDLLPVRKRASGKKNTNRQDKQQNKQKDKRKDKRKDKNRGKKKPGNKSRKNKA